MDLAIDVGNSQMTLGFGDDAGWRARWRLATDPRRTADEYRIVIGDLFRLDGFALEAVDAVVVSSVVPSLTGGLNAACRRLFAVDPLVVEPGVRTGLAIRYNPPAALGPDRVADAVAARARFGAPVVAVDFGTATTFNVVDRSGTFVGGAIAPGVGVAAAALAEAGARLSRIELATTAEPPPLVGRNTEASVRSGVVFGYAGLVEGLLGRIDAELGATDGSTAVVVASPPPPAVDGSPRPPVVATGGMAGLIAPLVPRITAIEPNLTLDGLRLILDLNRAPVGTRPLEETRRWA